MWLFENGFTEISQLATKAEMPEMCECAGVSGVKPQLFGSAIPSACCESKHSTLRNVFVVYLFKSSNIEHPFTDFKESIETKNITAKCLQEELAVSIYFFIWVNVGYV